MPYRVRELSQSTADAMKVLALSKLAVEEVGQGHDFDDDAVLYNCQHWTRYPARELCNLWLLETEEGEAVGYLAATTFQHFYNWTKGAKQEEWYIMPQHRSIITATILVKAFEDWAQSWGCSRIFMGIEYLTDNGLEIRIGKLIEHLGYKRRGAYYTKEQAV